MSFTFTRKINYYETDKMGIVHHSNYIRYMEEARCAWIESLGIPMKLIEERGFTIPTLEFNCIYKKPVTEGDSIAISIHLKEFNGVRMTISYEILNVQDGEKVAIASSKHCFTNLKLKPINIKKYDEEIYTKFASFLLEE